MLCGISALTTIGLRSYYAEQADLPTAREVCNSASRCRNRPPAQGGGDRPGARRLPRRGRAWCAVAAGILALVPSSAGRRTRSADASPVADFDDLIAANRAFADSFDLGGFDGVARAGVAIVTCMDSRIDPFRMLGLEPGDAKIFRNPGGRVTEQALEALVLGRPPARRTPDARGAAHPLRHGVGHRGGAARGGSASRPGRRVVAALRRGRPTKLAALDEDVAKVRSHPLIPDDVLVGGFLYDVDTGLLDRRL